MADDRADVGGSAPDEGQLAAERFRESRRSIARQLALAAGASCCVFVAAVPTYGWLPLVLGLFPLLGIVGALTEQPHHGTTPYIVGHLSWFLALGIIAARCGGAHSPLLPFVLPSALGLYSRLAPKLAIRSSVVAWGLTVGPVLIHDWAGFRQAPLLVLTCTAGLVGLGATAFTMSATEIEQREQATIDPLTGLLNRRGLVDRLREIRDQALVLKDDTPLALIACDIDHFKRINDGYGHGRGDDVLRDIAYLLRKGLRRFELVYRTGGEEFLLVLPGYDAERAAAMADRMRAAVEQGRPTGLEVTMSFGVAAHRADDVDLDELLDQADKALYRAKETGRNRVVTIGPGTLEAGTVDAGTS